jgi:hypothetical protein
MTPRALGGLVAAFAVVAGMAWAVLSLTWPDAPVRVNVRWRPDTTDAQRIDLEQRFRLTSAEHREGTTWGYQLADSSTANIRGLIRHEQVEDTARLNRIRYRPEFGQDRARQIAAWSVVIGGVGSVAFFVLASSRRMPAVPRSWAELTAALSPALRSLRQQNVSIDVRPMPPASYGRRVTVVALATGVVATYAMASLAGAAPWAAGTALIVVYVCGYLVGSLVVERPDGWSWGVIRTVAGLLLTATGFLLSLVLGVAWAAGPIALIVAAAYLRGRTAIAWPHGAIRFRLDGIAAGALAVILLAPIGITFFYMAPGSFPPVFYNVDTPPVLEKVRALVIANTYPPESLSNLGARRTYHYGSHAMAAVISRTTGLLPHHALFLIVLPLLTAGIVAAAVAVARYVGPAVPYSVSVPLLLVSTPSLSTPFWEIFGRQIWSAVASREVTIEALIGEYTLWGFLSNEAKNVGGDFLLLGSIAAIAAAPSVGWRLSALLIGLASLVKAPVGVALAAGLLFAQAWQAVVTKRLLPSTHAVMAGIVFVATFVVFFGGNTESNFRVELFPLYHLGDIAARGGLLGFVLDVAWLCLPALIVMTAGIGDPEKRSAPLLLMALAPIVVVNVTRLDSTGAGGAGASTDWLQILHATPFMLHAFALSVASRRWTRLDGRRRVAVVMLMMLAVAPVAVAAARYSLLLIRDPDSGHEFVDNRPLAEALAVIPTSGTVVVTNDLRYPAGNFTRDDRQMQIPALFGHQAFAVNYAYEVVPSARERRELQTLLQQPEWSDAILAAARIHGWTHLVIRKDYRHPTPLPLAQIFENAAYAVYRFPAQRVTEGMR